MIEIAPWTLGFMVTFLYLCIWNLKRNPHKDWVPHLMLMAIGLTETLQNQPQGLLVLSCLSTFSTLLSDMKSVLIRRRAVFCTFYSIASGLLLLASANGLTDHVQALMIYALLLRVIISAFLLGGQRVLDLEFSLFFLIETALFLVMTDLDASRPLIWGPGLLFVGTVIGFGVIGLTLRREFVDLSIRSCTTGLILVASVIPVPQTLRAFIVSFLVLSLGPVGVWIEAKRKGQFNPKESAVYAVGIGLARAGVGMEEALKTLTFHLSRATRALALMLDSTQTGIIRTLGAIPVVAQSGRVELYLFMIGLSAILILVLAILQGAV